MPAIITIPAAAALTGIPYSTLWEWVHTLPEWQACVSHRSGRRVYLSTVRLQNSGLLGAAHV